MLLKKKKTNYGAIYIIKIFWSAARKKIFRDESTTFLPHSCS